MLGILVGCFLLVILLIRAFCTTGNSLGTSWKTSVPYKSPKALRRLQATVTCATVNKFGKGWYAVEVELELYLFGTYSADLLRLKAGWNLLMKPSFSNQKSQHGIIRVSFWAVNVLEKNIDYYFISIFMYDLWGVGNWKGESSRGKQWFPFFYKEAVLFGEKLDSKVSEYSPWIARTCKALLMSWFERCYKHVNIVH